MAINLEKGASLNLTKESKGLAKVQVELGWVGNADLDLMAFCVKDDGKVPSDGYFVFFNQQNSADGAVVAGEDAREGGDDGDTEQIDVDLSQVAAVVKKIVFVSHIYAGAGTFGEVSDAYIRILDAAGGTEFVRYDLGEDFSTETTVHFAELYRDGSEWQFRALGRGTQEDLTGLARSYGVNV